MSDLSEQNTKKKKRVAFFRAFIFVIAVLAAFAALVLPLILSPNALPLAVGDVAPRDMQAPYTANYESEIRTEEARQIAASTVPLVYTLADPTVARGQIKNLRSTLLYIATVRADRYASEEELVADLNALESISLQKETMSTILSLNDAQWETVQQEALSVLEQVMRNDIRSKDVVSIQKGVPSRVSLALTEIQAQVVAELVRAFIVPNSLYSDDLTEASRNSAREAVDPIIQYYKAGENVVSAGQIITAANLEALENLGLVQSEEEWQKYLGAGALTLVMALFLWLYFRYRPARLLKKPRNLIVVSIVFLIFLVGARLLTPIHAIIPYLYPLPAFGLLIATLFGTEIALVLTLPLSLLTGYGASNTFDLTAYYLLTSLISILILSKAQQVWSFLKAGFAILLVGTATIFAYWFPYATTDATEIATLVGATAFNGISSASLTLLLQFFIAQLLGLVTTLRLLEISRPDAPLLQLLLRDAPGTYQHSLQVANLAERGAESIGADALLVRVGTLFHDIGKAQNPLFFIENQVSGNLNTHEDLAPEESAEIIIRHVTDGVSLAKKHRLPSRLIDFITEHHGTNITRYQYMQALKDVDGDVTKVDLGKFRYPGPPPRSRETAILMLADGTEAITRAERPQTEQELRKLVHKIFDNVQKSGQLKDTRLTLQDITKINESFVSTLRGSLHPRVKYPKERVASSGVPTRPRKKEND